MEIGTYMVQKDGIFLGSDIVEAQQSLSNILIKEKRFLRHKKRIWNIAAKNHIIY